MRKSAQLPTRGPARGLRRGRVRQPTPAALTLRRAGLESFQTAGPFLLSEMIQDLIKSEAITIVEDPTEPVPEDPDPSSDCEIDAEDEDESEVCFWSEDPPDDRNPVWLGLDDLPEVFETSDTFALLCANGRCQLHVPDWYQDFRGRTSWGRTAIWELDRRLQTLQALAEWLSRERSDFLRDPRFFLLGPQSLEEVRNNQVSVQQSHLLPLLGIRGEANRIHKSTFGRYLKNTELVWSNHLLPASCLFSPEAARGWVARALALFIRRHASDHSQEAILARLHGASGRRAGRAAEKWQPKDRKMSSFTVRGFLERILTLANCRWTDVLEAHRDEIFS